jgi:hypothetical protein
MYCEMAEVRANMSSFKVIMTDSTDIVRVLKVSCDRKSLYLPELESLNLKREVLKSVFFYSNVRRTLNNTDTCFRIEQL